MKTLPILKKIIVLFVIFLSYIFVLATGQMDEKENYNLKEIQEEKQNYQREYSLEIFDAMEMIKMLYQWRLFPELENKNVAFRVSLWRKIDYSVGDIDISFKVTNKDEDMFENDYLEMVENDFSHPYIIELIECLKLFDWEYFFMKDNHSCINLLIDNSENIPYENVIYNTKIVPDTISWNNSIYLAREFIFDWDIDVYTKIRPYLKDEFTLKCFRGYIACWEVIGGELYLKKMFLGKSGKLVPLNEVFLQEKEFKASWFTGDFHLVSNEKLGNLAPYIEIPKTELILKIYEGKIIKSILYQNRLDPRDKEGFLQRLLLVNEYD